jgi:osmotically-inducible protein OsmY
VYLKGVVDSVTQANLAVQMAEATMGVKDVDTMKLYVKSSDQPTQDTYITAKIKGVLIRESLRNENYIDLKNIIVETKNGVVYLSGFVLTEDEETRAINLAQNIHGVEKVKSAIKTRD